MRKAASRIMALVLSVLLVFGTISTALAEAVNYGLFGGGDFSGVVLPFDGSELFPGDDLTLTYMLVNVAEIGDDTEYKVVWTLDGNESDYTAIDGDVLTVCEYEAASALAIGAAVYARIVTVEYVLPPQGGTEESGGAENSDTEDDEEQDEESEEPADDMEYDEEYDEVENDEAEYGDSDEADENGEYLPSDENSVPPPADNDEPYEVMVLGEYVHYSDDAVAGEAVSDDATGDGATTDDETENETTEDSEADEEENEEYNEYNDDQENNDSIYVHPERVETVEYVQVAFAEATVYVLVIARFMPLSASCPDCTFSWTLNPVGDRDADVAFLLPGGANNVGHILRLAIDVPTAGQQAFVDLLNSATTDVSLNFTNDGGLVNATRRLAIWTDLSSPGNETTDHLLSTSYITGEWMRTGNTTPMNNSIPREMLIDASDNVASFIYVTLTTNQPDPASPNDTTALVSNHRGQAEFHRFIHAELSIPGSCASCSTGPAREVVLFDMQTHPGITPALSGNNIAASATGGWLSTHLGSGVGLTVTAGPPRTIVLEGRGGVGQAPRINLAALTPENGFIDGHEYRFEYTASVATAVTPRIRVEGGSGAAPVAPGTVIDGAPAAAGAEFTHSVIWTAAQISSMGNATISLSSNPGGAPEITTYTQIRVVRICPSGCDLPACEPPVAENILFDMQTHPGIAPGLSGNNIAASATGGWLSTHLGSGVGLTVTAGPPRTIVLEGRGGVGQAPRINLAAFATVNSPIDDHYYRLEYTASVATAVTPRIRVEGGTGAPVGLAGGTVIDGAPAAAGAEFTHSVTWTAAQITAMGNATISLSSNPGGASEITTYTQIRVVRICPDGCDLPECEPSYGPNCDDCDDSGECCDECGHRCDGDPHCDNDYCTWCVLSGSHNCTCPARALNPTMTGPFTITNPYASVNWATHYQFRTALHVHTTRSDGNALLRDTVADHFNKGFDILAVTDHNVICTGDWSVRAVGPTPRTWSWWPPNDWRNPAHQMTIEERDSVLDGTFTGPFPTSLFMTNGGHRTLARRLAGHSSQSERGMAPIPYANEQTYMNHVNTYWANFTQSVPQRATMEAPAPLHDHNHNEEHGVFRRAQELGGVTMIAHPGRHTWYDSPYFPAHRDWPGNFRGQEPDLELGMRASNNPLMVEGYASWFKMFYSVLGFELYNRADGETRSDRILWDNVLMETMPAGRNVWALSADDSHGIEQTGYNWNVMLLPPDSLHSTNSLATRDAMLEGAFYAVTRIDRRLGVNPGAAGNSASGRGALLSQPTPVINSISVDGQVITVDADMYGADSNVVIQWVTGNPWRGGYGGTRDLTRGGGVVIHEGPYLDLAELGRYVWGNYVRVQIIGYIGTDIPANRTGVALTNPFGVYSGPAPTFIFPNLDSVAPLNPNDWTGQVWHNWGDHRENLWELSGGRLVIPHGTPVEEWDLPDTAWIETERGWGYHVFPEWDFDNIALLPGFMGEQQITLRGYFEMPDRIAVGNGTRDRVFNPQNHEQVVELGIIIEAWAAPPELEELVWVVMGDNTSNPTSNPPMPTFVDPRVSLVGPGASGSILLNEPTYAGDFVVLRLCLDNFSQTAPDGITSALLTFNMPSGFQNRRILTWTDLSVGPGVDPQGVTHLVSGNGMYVSVHQTAGDAPAVATVSVPTAFLFDGTNHASALYITLTNNSGASPGQTHRGRGHISFSTIQLDVILGVPPEFSVVEMWRMSECDYVQALPLGAAIADDLGPHLTNSDDASFEIINTPGNTRGIAVSDRDNYWFGLDVVLESFDLVPSQTYRLTFVGSGGTTPILIRRDVPPWFGPGASLPGSTISGTPADGWTASVEFDLDSIAGEEPAGSIRVQFGAYGVGPHPDFNIYEIVLERVNFYCCDDNDCPACLDRIAVADALAAITWDSIRGENTLQSEVRTNLGTLPTSINGVSIAWHSSRPATLNAATGVVTRPTDGDVSVVLTATLFRGVTALSEIFSLVVLEQGDDDGDYDLCDICDNDPCTCGTTPGEVVRPRPPGGGGAVIVRPAGTQPAEPQATTTQAPGGFAEGNDSVLYTVAVTHLPVSPMRILVSLADFDLEGVNVHRLVAVTEDGEIIGGRFDTDTGYFVFEAEFTGSFTIEYVEELRRLVIGLDSYFIVDLADNAMSLAMDVLPIVEGGRTLLPIRFISYALGAEVGWDDATRQVSLTKDGQTLIVPIGVITPELSALGMDVPPMIVDGRTMLPARFVAYFFGAVVDWDDTTRSFEIIL
ncbi:MAG: stalk domain-containing protein [Defluviitaleaceae bacterium]|nr:stalk domain-containing protein [Defluviitaleaceae bacterium]